MQQNSNGKKHPEKARERSDELKRIVAVLNDNFTRLQKKYNIKELGIIGSYARGEQTEESDLDILVDFYKPIGWEVVDLRDELEEIPGLHVDLVLKSGMKQRKRVFDGIAEDAVYVKA